MRTTTNTRFPWYDSYWFYRYVSAKAYIAEKYPDRLIDFEETLSPLKTRPDFEVQHLRNIIEPAIMPRICESIASLKAKDLELHEIKTFGRWVVHDNPILTELQDSMTNKVAELAQEEIEPSYNFLSLYTRLGRCPVHMDAPEAKWTLDICVEQSEPWPIHFSQLQAWPEDFNHWGDDWEEQIKSNPKNVFTQHTLQPGEAILFSGSSQWHYRDPLPVSNNKSFCHLLFFHFIPKGLGLLIKPSNWEKLFDLPGLSQAIGKDSY